MTDYHREIRHKYHTPADEQQMSRRAELVLGSGLLASSIGGLALAHECLDNSQYAVAGPVGLASIILLGAGSRSLAIQANQSIENFLARRQQSTKGDS